jgi:cytochrome c-type protein NapC
MDLSEQERYSRTRHERAMDEGKTCIDCHEGIAHRLPKDSGDDR